MDITGHAVTSVKWIAQSWMRFLCGGTHIGRTCVSCGARSGIRHVADVDCRHALPVVSTQIGNVNVLFLAARCIGFSGASKTSGRKVGTP